MNIVSIFLFVFMLAPACVYAGTQLSAAVADFLSAVVWPLVSAFIAAAAGWAAVWIGRKYKLAYLVENERRIEDAAYRGVAFAEETAAKLLKEKNIKVSSNEKLNMAVAEVLKSAPSVTREQAELIVESILARVFGAGASGDVVVR